ncbi:class I SAM-dependent methyltransferase [Ruminiclostridium herbifermentans]|nr:class I SAM-dependent methyltransferase [Ruminiclostridium herbifermentans]
MSIDFYNKNSKEFFESTVSADMTETYIEFLKYIEPNGKLLDAGCGSGRDSLFFLGKGFSVVSIDASDEMVRLSSELTGQKTVKMKFQEMNFNDEFDGVWACASLLHVSKSEIKDVIKRIANSLKLNGIFYASFKYGEGEIVRDGRLFNSYNEESLKSLIEMQRDLKILKIWKTQDVRPDRENEYWVNVLCKKE